MEKNEVSINILKSADASESEIAKDFRNRYFFNPIGIEDPYTWTFDHKEHIHLLMYQEKKALGYAHIQLWKENRAALRIIVIDEDVRNNGLGSLFLSLCEDLLKKMGCKSLHVQASPKALCFYRKNNYVSMPFNDPDNYESDPLDTPVGKILA